MWKQEHRDWTTLPLSKLRQGIPEMQQRGRQLTAAITGKNQLRPGSEAVPPAIDALAKKITHK